MAKAKSEFLFVEGGEKLLPGQIAIMEVHPDHPYATSTHRYRDFDGKAVENEVGENQAYIVKGDEKVGQGWVGRTSTVVTKIRDGELQECDIPDGVSTPSKMSPTETSKAAASIKESKVPVTLEDEDEDKEVGTVATASGGDGQGADIQNETGGEKDQGTPAASNRGRGRP